MSKSVQKHKDLLLRILTLLIMAVGLMACLLLPSITPSQAASTYVFIFMLLLAVGVTLIAKSRPDAFWEEHEDGIGWLINAFFSFAAPIVIAISVAYIDTEHMDFAMSYISAGFSVYVGLRLQAVWNKVFIIPTSIIIAGGVLSHLYGSSALTYSVVIGSVALFTGLYKTRIHINQRNDKVVLHPNILVEIDEATKNLSVEEQKDIVSAYALTIRDYFVNFAIQQNNDYECDLILNQVSNLSPKYKLRKDTVPSFETAIQASINECRINPRRAIRRMLTTPLELALLYQSKKDKYYNLQTIEDVIHEECMLMSKERRGRC